MTIQKTADGGKLTMGVEGRLDTNTAPQLEKEIRDSLEGVTELIVDFTQLSYISSAGLRVLLAAQKLMNKQGSMVVIGASDAIKEIFDVTGFMDILTVQ